MGPINHLHILQCSCYGFLCRDANESRHCHIRLKGFRQVNLINAPTTSENSAGLKAYRFKQKCQLNQNVNTHTMYSNTIQSLAFSGLTDDTGYDVNVRIGQHKAQLPDSIYVKLQKHQEIFIPLVLIVSTSNFLKFFT